MMMTCRAVPDARPHTDPCGSDRGSQADPEGFLGFAAPPCDGCALVWPSCSLTKETSTLAERHLRLLRNFLSVLKQVRPVGSAGNADGPRPRSWAVRQAG